MKGARGRFNIAVVGGAVYAVGGSNGLNELFTVEKFDPVQNKWMRVAGLPVARSNAGTLIADSIRALSRKLPEKFKLGIVQHELTISYFDIQLPKKFELSTMCFNAELKCQYGSFIYLYNFMVNYWCTPPDSLIFAFIQWRIYGKLR